MSPVTFHPSAEDEIWEALAYYERRRMGLGAEFRRDFEAALKRVRENPQAYAIDDDTGARFCSLRRFPYTIVYVDLDDRIWVAAVAHHRRRPGYWKRRRSD